MGETLTDATQPCTNWTFEDVGEQIWPLFETEPSTGRPIRRAMYEDDQYAARCSAKWSWQSKCLEKAGVNLVRDHFQAIVSILGPRGSAKAWLTRLLQE